MDSLPLPHFKWLVDAVKYEVDLGHRPELPWAAAAAAAPKGLSALDVLRGYGDELGWTDATQFGVLADFVNEAGLAPALQQYAAERARAEADASEVVV